MPRQKKKQDLFKSPNSNQPKHDLPKKIKTVINSPFRLVITSQKGIKSSLFRSKIVSIRSACVCARTRLNTNKQNINIALTQIEIILDTDSVLLCWNMNEWKLNKGRHGGKLAMCIVRTVCVCVRTWWSVLINKTKRKKEKKNTECSHARSTHSQSAAHVFVQSSRYHHGFHSINKQ